MAYAKRFSPRPLLSLRYEVPHTQSNNEKAHPLIQADSDSDNLKNIPLSLSLTLSLLDAMYLLIKCMVFTSSHTVVVFTIAAGACVRSKFK